MTRTTLLLLTAAAAALTGCGQRHWSRADRDDNDRTPMKVVNELQCPDHQGSLTRVRVAPDGLSCDYAGPRGAEVKLELVKPEDEDSAAALDKLDAEMNALMPEVKEKVGEGPAAVEEADNDNDNDADSDAGPSSSRRSRENVDVNLPGFHVRTHNGRAQIRMFGMSIDADDEGKGTGHDGAAHVVVGNGLVDVRARNEAAIVRVRGKGRGVHAEYRLADKAGSPDGWRLVGYEARGPAGAPMVVAVVKSKDQDTSEDPLFRDAGKLVRANVGG